MNSKINLSDVLHLAVHAAYGSCEIIRAIASRGTKKVELKDITDPKSALTEADELAQAYIEELFNHAFPEISLVGEEDEASSETTERLGNLTNELKKDGKIGLYQEHFSENDIEEVGDGVDFESDSRSSRNSTYLLKYRRWMKQSIEEKINSKSLDADSQNCLLNKIEADRICIFVDPLDGTGEFVAKRYEAVQTLIGIAIDGRPIAGVIGIPFPLGSSHSKILFGVVGLGISGDLEELRECYKINRTCDSFPSYLKSRQTMGTNLNGLLLERANEYSKDLLEGICVREIGLASDNQNSIVDEWMEKELHQGNKDGNSTKLSLSMSTDLGAGIPPSEVLRNVLLNRENNLQTDILLAGACGHRFLRLLLDQADCGILNLKCSRWDTCATSALLVAVGGKVTNLLNFPMEYFPNQKSYNNSLGTFLSGPSFEKKLGMSHSTFLQKFALTSSDLIKCLASEYLSGVSSNTADDGVAIDIARPITCKSRPGDQPFTKTELSKMVFGVEDGRTVISDICVPESNTVRYKQSNCTRLFLKVGNHEDNVYDKVTGEKVEPSQWYSVFYKRIVPREMPYAVEKFRKYPFKTDRDRLANINERNFLLWMNDLREEWNRFANKEFQIGSAYELQHEQFSKSSLDANFSLLLYDLSPERGFVQSPFLSLGQLLSGVRYLAFQHVFFWNRERSNKKDSDGSNIDVLPTATYWDMSKQAAGQPEKLKDCWDIACKELELENTSVCQTKTENPGKKLASLAEKLNARIHKNPQTVIHGDPKAANFFFTNQKTTISDSSSVAVVDFQWSGYGRCTADLAYFVAAGIDPELAKTDLSRFFNKCKLSGGDGRVDGDAKDADKDSLTYRILAHYESSFKEFWERLYSKSENEKYDFPTSMQLDEPGSSEGLFQDYKDAFCDLMRVALVDHYGLNFKAETLRKREKLEGNAKLPFNAYNKSCDVGRWMLCLLFEFLENM